MLYATQMHMEQLHTHVQDTSLAEIVWSYVYIIIRTHLYGKKSHFYGMTVKTGVLQHLKHPYYLCLCMLARYLN